MSGDNNRKILRILKDIKSIKIQGAEKVAKAGITAYLLHPTKENAKRIVRIRPTEPLLQNALKILVKATDKERAAKVFLSELEKSHDKIANEGAKLIKSDMNVFTHCHSSTVIDILKAAKKMRKKFVVYTAEVEPLLQGRMTAKDLAMAGIKVVVGPDMAMEQMIERCDIVLFGSDAFTSRAVVNKIGTETICRLAKEFKIPAYACGVSMKITNKVKIEMRSGKEVWDERYKNIDVIYPAFDKVNYKIVHGVISEFGILKPNVFVRKAKRKIRSMSKV